MTGAAAGWAIPAPHRNIGNRLRALMTAIMTVGERCHDRSRRTSEPYYPGLREPMFEEAAMAREMYRL